MAKFGWCLAGQHENCMLENGNLLCSCDCENHGSKYQDFALTAEQKNLRVIANSALAANALAKANKVDLRKKNNEPVMTYEEALESIGVGKAKNKKPDATTIEELKLSR